MGLEKKTIMEKIYRRFCARILRPYPRTQMDADSKMVGDVSVDKESNVILKVDEEADVIKVLDVSSAEITKQLSSTEKPFDLVGDGYSMMNRWYPLQQVVINTTSTDLFSLRIPEALYTDKTSVNLLPLKGFIYADLDLEFKLVINAAPFHAGRVIMGIFYCSQGYNKTYDSCLGINVDKTTSFNYDYYESTQNTMISTYQGMVQRPHVLLDLSESTTASILMKYNYNKSFVRLLDYSKNTDVNPGVIGGHFAQLKATMVSALRTGDDQPKSVNCTLFYRFVKAKLTGMTRQHDLTQMDFISTISDTLHLGEEILGTGADVIDKVERQLTRKGKRISNRDKPSMQFATIPVVPRFRNHFPNGVGISDAVILGMDVKSLTTHYEDCGLGPRSYNELAKLPGILTVYNWKSEIAANKTLFSERVQPYDQFVIAAFNASGNTNLGTASPLPLHVACNGFMYWSGTIVYEFDFVKTAFHKGLVMISINYGKKNKDGAVGSNYEKIVDIQETSRVKITVPYIYDTIARRTNNCSVLTTWPQPAQWHPDALPAFNQTTISLIVMNPLIPIDSVANNIDIVVWKYGGPDFCLNTPCQVNNIVTYKSGGDDLSLQRFPVATNSDYVTMTEYKNNLPLTQGDFDDFTPGMRDDMRFHTGDDTNFKNLLRIPVRIVVNESIKAAKVLCLPVVPLTIDLIKWYSTHPRLSMTHQSQILRMFRMWRGTIRYTILIHTKDPVFVTHLPADGTWKARLQSKYFNERIPGTGGTLYDPYATAVPVNTFYDDNTLDLTSSGNFTTMILPSLNPTEQVEIPWNLPVNWALMNQDTKLEQGAFRDIGNTPNGHLCLYADKDFTASVFLNVGDDFEMGAFCGLTDNIVVNKGIRMDDARYKGVTQMDFHHEEFTSDGDLSDYYSCEESHSRFKNIGTFIKRNKVKVIKPLLFGGASLLPAPLGTVIQGLVYAHTIGTAEDKLSNMENNIVKICRKANKLNPDSFNRTMDESSKVMNRINRITLNSAESLLEECKCTASKIGGAVDKSLEIATHLDTVTLCHADKILEGCAKVSSGVSEFVGRVQSGPSGEDLMNWLATTFSYVGKDLFDGVSELFKLLYENIIKGKIQGICKYLIDSITSLSMATVGYVKSRLGLFYDLLTRLFTSLLSIGKTQMFDSQNELDIDCFNTSDIQTLVGLLMGGVLSVYGPSGTTNWQKTYSKDQLHWTNNLLSFKTVAGTNTCITFIKNIYSTLFKMVVKVFGIKNEELIIREALSSSSSVVSVFCKNAQEFLNDYNNEVIGDPLLKSKFWITICNAYQIQASLCKIKGDSATNVLKSLCQEVIKKSNESMSLFKASCVRYEPFVICLEGESGIGKSFLTTRLSVDILNNLKLKMPTIDFRYNVSPGVDYWNLYNGQPIIVYDDWCNLVDTQSIRKEISELYQLKTSNVMNAPKAELSEKKTVVNPFAVLMATNNPFPKTNTLIDHTPLYRRRDVLVKVRVRKGVDLNDKNQYKNFNHLEFAFYDNSACDQRQFQFVSFGEFQAEIKRRHTIYHQCEAENVKARISILSEALTEQALIHSDIEDPFTLQARCLYEAENKAVARGKVNSLPSEVLTFEVLQLIDMIEEKFNIVQTQGQQYIIEDKCQLRHATQLPNTQGFSSSINTYFVTPVIRTFNTLYSYLCKWLRLGMYCGICGTSALNSGISFDCSRCGKLHCGWCYRLKEKMCGDCNEPLVIASPKFFDIIIAFVCQAATNIMMPKDWKSILCAKLISYIIELDVGVPLLVISFLKSTLGHYSNNNNVQKLMLTAVTQGDYEEPAPPLDGLLSSIKTQTERIKRDLNNDDVVPPQLPSNFRVRDVNPDGNCFAYSVFLGLQQFDSFKVQTFGEFKKKLLEKKNFSGTDKWFDSDIHGPEIVRQYGIPIHLIEKLSVDGKEVWSDSMITRTEVKQIAFDYDSNDANICIHILNEGKKHFKAILVDKVEAIKENEFTTLNADFIKSILGEEKISPKIPSIDKDLKLVKPADWWYTSMFAEPLNELHCCHQEAPIFEGSKIVMLDDSWEYEGKVYLFKRCNPQCCFRESALREIVDKYYDANKLTMEEQLKLMSTSKIPWEQTSIPKIFRSKWMQEQFDKIRDEIVDDSNWFWPLVRNLMTITLAGGVFLAIFFFFKRATGFAFSALSLVMSYFFGQTQSLDSRGAENYTARMQRMRKVARERGKTQASEADTENYINIKNKISKNYVLIKTDTVKRMIGIGLFGSTILVPKHYLSPLRKAKKIEIQFFQAKHESLVVVASNIEIRLFNDKDCVLMEVSKAIYFTDIRKFFMPQTEYNNYVAYRSEILVPKGEKIVEHDIKINRILPDYEAFDEYSHTMYKTKGAFEYDFEQRGACGSVILSRNSNHPIVGIHIAGHENLNRGVGARINREELGDKIVLDLPDYPFELEEEGLLDFGEEVNVEYLGRVKADMTPFLPCKTNIEHSLIDSHFTTPNLVAPAILSSKDERYLFKETSPLIFGVKKHGKPTLDFPKDFVDKAQEALTLLLMNRKWTFNHRVQIYDLKQAALGLREYSDYYEWLPDSTSAGWPYNVMNSGSGLKTQKKYWMTYVRNEQNEPIDVIFDPMVLEHVERDMRERRKGVLAPIVFQDVLKDEKRPIEKLLKPGGTRVFSMSPINASLVLRQYTLDFTSFLRAHRIDNWIAIGINPDGPEWGKLVSMLKTKGDNIFTIDYSNFGPGLNVEVASRIRFLIQGFYGKYDALKENDDLVIQSLIFELMYSTHLAGGTLYRTKSGSPSGAAITVEINSFTHLMYILICWLIIGRVLLLMNYESLTRDQSDFLKTYTFLVEYFDSKEINVSLFSDMNDDFTLFFDNVIGNVYGDDGIFSVKNDFKEVFNAKTIALALQAHGICATDASKTDKIVPYGTLRDMSFLKRGFEHHPHWHNEWLAPISTVSVEECARWIQRGQGADVMTLENAKASLLLAYGHGKKYYDTWKYQLNEFLAEEGLENIYLTWENIDQLFYSSYHHNIKVEKELSSISDKVKSYYTIQ